MKFNQGIALVQVLLISGILTVFALFMNQQAQEQVRLALLAQQRAQAELLLVTAKNRVFLALMTEPRFTPNTRSNEQSVALSQKWNFYNRPFELMEHVTVEMQDQAGLLSLHLPHVSRLSRLLRNNGVSYERSEQIIGHLLDWQDSDNKPRTLGRESNFQHVVRNGNIQSLLELDKVIELSPEERKLLTQNCTIYYNGDFNPFHAPIELISALSSSESGNRISEMRQYQQLDINEFNEITGIRDDDISFFPVNTVSIKIHVSYFGVELEEQIVARLNPYAVNKQLPIKLLAQRRL